MAQTSKNITAVTLPKMGLTMETGSIAAWHIDENAEVQEGDEIADIETEKVTTAYEAPASGVWRRSIAKIGVEMPVGELIGVIADRDTSEKEITVFIEQFTNSLV